MLNIKSRWSKLLSGLVSVAVFGAVLSISAPAKADLLPPVIATVSPATGTITGGEEITVTGANLQYVTGGNLGVGGIDFTHWVTRANDGSWLKFRAPDAATIGLVDLSLYGQVNITEPKVYTYTATSITSVTPNVGATPGGTAISIKGVGFGPLEWGDGSLIVTVGGNRATNVVRVSPTEIKAVTPIGVLGQADIVVSFANDQYTHYSNNVLTGTKLYTYVAGSVAPIINSITPNKGTIDGGNTVTIKGQFLKDANNVNGVFTFDGLTATLVSLDPTGTTAVVTTPAHALGAVDVKAITSAGSATTIKGFTYSPPPTLTSIAATGGVTQGGTKVTITGTNFGTTGAPVVKIGGKLALCTKLVSSTTITAVTRDGAAGAADVAVTATTGAGTATLTGAYTYATPVSTPAIDSITPNSGPTTGNTAIEIHSSDVFPADVPNVMIGQLCALSATRVDDHTIRAVVPAGAVGAKNVSLTFNTSYSISTLGYTYVPAPAPEITSLTPSTGFITGGDSILLTGRGFGLTGTPTVTFGGVAATNVIRLSETTVYATNPAGTVGAKDVVLTPYQGTPITKAGGFTYKGPSVLKITPANGTVDGGTAVTIEGDGFGLTGTPTVTFGGKTATSIVRLSSTQITAVTPSGSAGASTVVITPAGGSAITNSSLFTYLPNRFTPLIYSSTPGTGPQAGGITVTVTGANFKSSAGTTTIVKIAGQNAANVVINGDGTVVTFTAPALNPGSYEILIKTDKGTAWRTLYQVLPPPTLLGCPAAVSQDRLNPDGGSVLTIYGDRFGTTITAPTVNIGGVSMPVSGWGYDSYNHIWWVTVTDAGGSFGYQDIQVIPADNSGSATLSNCVYRQADASITADDKEIIYGDPTPEFTKTVVGEKGSDKITTVTYTFTGINGITYGPSTTPPTASGAYTITPSNGVMSPGDINNYTFAYINGTYIIHGLGAYVTALDASKIYGDADPTFSTLVTGVAAGEVEKDVVLTFSGTAYDGSGYGPSTTPPIKAGVYTITPSNEHLVSGNDVNYSFGYITGTYTIEKRRVDITAVDQQKTYGDADPALPWEFKDPQNTNLVYGDTILAGKLGRVEGELVGVYAINIGTLSNDNDNYDVHYELGNLSINARHISITAENKTKVYGYNDPTLTYTTDGLQFEDKVGGFVRDAGQDVGTYAINNSNIVEGVMGVGTIHNKDGVDVTADYVLDSFTPGVFTITPRPVTVTPYEQSKVYGELDPTNFTTGGNGVAYHITSLVGLAYNTDAFSGSVSRAVGEDLGKYEIYQGNVTLGDNYTITWVTGKKFTINPRPIYLTADDQTKVYGDLDPSPFTYTVKTGDGYYDLLGSDSITGAASRAAGENVGNYNISVGSLDAGSNYVLYFFSGKLTITKRAITIRPDALEKQYGDNNPATYTYSVVDGSLQGDDSLTGKIGRVVGENVGDYEYNDGTFWFYDTNYDVTVDKTNHFTITKKDIDVTAVAKTKTYGDDDPALTFTYTPSTMPNGAPINLAGELARAAGEDVGEWDITQGTLDGGTNFNLKTFTGAKLTITKRSISVVADDQTAEYGATLPENGFTLQTGSTLGFSDTLVSATYTYSTEPPVNAGDYDITPSAATFGVGSASNYDISYVNGTLTITPIAIEITADDASKTYGDVDPAFTYTVTNGALLNEDTLAGSLSRETGENVGDYAITVGSVSGGTNYIVTVLGGKFTINKLHVKVTPDAADKFYGDNDPAFTFTTDITLPFEESLGGSLGRAEGENVGDYDFTIGDVDTSNSNYEVELIPAKFTINKLDIAVTVKDATKVYGDEDPALEFTYSPATLPNGTEIVLTGAPTRDAGEAVGDYSITQGDLDGGDNFNLTGFTGAKLTITKRAIHIVAGDQSAVYGQALPENSYSLVEGYTLAFDDALSGASYTYSTEPPVHVGSYDITPSDATFSTGSIDNYEVTYVDGTLTITKASLTINLDNASSNYGETAPAFKVATTDGLVEGDVLGNIDYTVDGNPVPAIAPGSYVLDGTLTSFETGSLDDYEITVVPATYQIDGPQVITFDPPQGPVSGGTEFTIYGSGFGFNTPTVLFDGFEATNVVLVDSGTITGITPEHVEGPVDVQLITDVDTFDLGTVFTYIPPVPAPSILFVNPNISPAKGGAIITLNGANFCGTDRKAARIYVRGRLVAGVTVSRDCKTVRFAAPANPVGNYTLEIKTNDGATRYAPGVDYVANPEAAKKLKTFVIFDGDKSVLKPDAIKELKRIAKILKGKKNLKISVAGWVHRTATFERDKPLSLARARNSANFLKKLGVKATFTLSAKGIYRVGDYTDRRAEITATYTE